MIEMWEHGLGMIAQILRLTLEGISVLCVFLGLIYTGNVLFKYPVKKSSLLFIEVRIVFGSWLGLALEFQLGADILNTTVSPSFDSLGKLGIIALIRTFLNYFLSKELEAEIALKEKQQQRQNHQSLD